MTGVSTTGSIEGTLPTNQKGRADGADRPGEVDGDHADLVLTVGQLARSEAPEAGLVDPGSADGLVVALDHDATAGLAPAVQCRSAVVGGVALVVGFATVCRIVHYATDRGAPGRRRRLRRLVGLNGRGLSVRHGLRGRLGVRLYRESVGQCQPRLGLGLPAGSGRVWRTNLGYHGIASGLDGRDGGLDQGRKRLWQRGARQGGHRRQRRGLAIETHLVGLAERAFEPVGADGNDADAVGAGVLRRAGQRPFALPVHQRGAEALLARLNDDPPARLGATAQGHLVDGLTRATQVAAEADLYGDDARRERRGMGDAAGVVVEGLSSHEGLPVKLPDGPGTSRMYAGRSTWLLTERTRRWELR
jgi:hypothetical protein